MRGKGCAATLAVAVLAGCSVTQLDNAPGTLAVSPLPDFGHVILGRSATASLHVTNLGRIPITISSLAQAPGLPDFSVGVMPPLTLAPEEAAQIPVTFTPKALGKRDATLHIVSNATTSDVHVTLSGTGVLGNATISPLVLDFGEVGLTSTRTLSLVVTDNNPDPAGVNVESVGGADPESFTASPAGQMTIAAGTTSLIDVTFQPWRLGSFTATLPVQLCPTCSPTIITMLGVGIASSIVVAPAELDFGPTISGTPVIKSVTITNLGSQPVTLSPAEITGQTSSGFSLQSPTMTASVLTQNESATVPVSYDPLGMGADTGELRVPTSDDGTPVVIVPLTGQGIGPMISVTPDEISFPKTAIGLQVQKVLDVRNVGVDPTGTHPLIVSGWIVANGPAFTVTGPPLPMSLPAGNGEYLTITYQPPAVETDNTVLLIESNDPLHPVLSVPLHGSSEKLGNCSYRVEPPALDFGAVVPGASAQLSFIVRNVGTTDCAIANIALAPGSAPEFSVTAVSTRLIPIGSDWVVPVTLKSDGPGPWTGTVTFDMTSTTEPHAQVPLTASGADSCFQVVPQALNFGTVGLMCAAPTLSVSLENTCAVPVTVMRSYIGASPTNAFSVVPATAGMQTVPPGGQSTVSVTYAPTVAETDNAPLFVATSLQAQPYLVELDGAAVQLLTQTDTYQLPMVQQVDVLWIVDNSGSMANKQANLAANAAAFIKMAVANNVDFHIAVTTTGLFPYTAGWTQCPGGASGGEDGRFFPVDNSITRILSLTTPNVEATFSELVQVGTCHWIETGLEAARLALTAPLITDVKAPGTPWPDDGNAGFLRPTARLYLIWVTDEDDVIKDPNGDDKIPNPVPVQTYVNTFLGLKPGRPDMVGASAIIGLPGSCNGNIDGVGYRYEQLVQQFGGQIADICSPDWGNVINSVATAAFQPELAFPLSMQPGNRTITVEINGVAVPSTDSNGNQVWYYDPTLGNYGEVVFSANAAPGPGSTVTLTYQLPCPT